MPQQVFQNCKLWLAQYDLSAKMNALAIADTPDMLDNTVFGNTAKSRKKGLSAVAANHQGFWDITADDAIWNDFDVTNVPMTFGPIGGAEGERAYSFCAQTAEYNLEGVMGELFKFSVKAENAGGNLIRGTILFNDTKTATNVETAYNLGAVVAGQKLYGALHVTAASAGDTLDVIIQSDIAENMADPTTRITFAQKSAVGYEWATPVAGPILDVAEADNWWRVSWTIGGVDPSFTFAVFCGIQ